MCPKVNSWKKKTIILEVRIVLLAVLTLCRCNKVITQVQPSIQRQSLPQLQPQGVQLCCCRSLALPPTRSASLLGQSFGFDLLFSIWNLGNYISIMTPHGLSPSFCWNQGELCGAVLRDEGLGWGCKRSVQILLPDKYETLHLITEFFWQKRECQTWKWELQLLLAFRICPYTINIH